MEEEFKFTGIELVPVAVFKKRYGRIELRSYEVLRITESTEIDPYISRSEAMDALVAINSRKWRIE